ncbi:MAG: S1/P1 nuclease [Pyrinomonadaceae bacterium]
MRKLPLKYFIPAVAVLFLSLSVRAWDDAGHKLSAYIAWQQMSPEAREKAFELLIKAPEDSDLSVYYNAYESRSAAAKKLELFMMAATWADVIRNRDFKVRYEKYNHSDWHYADIFWKQNGDQAEILENFPEESGKAIPKLSDFEKTLRDPQASEADKAVALAWFLHVGGDIHNPLHNASRVTEMEPKGDQGGNLFLLSPQDAPREARLNLHSFWDSIITRNMPRKNDACDADYIAEVAKKVMKKYPFSKMKDRIKPGDFRAWHQEGFRLLPTAVYDDLKRNQMPPKKYLKNSFRIGQEELVLAGYRLGETLNRIFSEKNGATGQIPSGDCRIIQRVLYPVSKRRTPDQKMRIALLDICPENRGIIARPMTSAIIDGEMKYFEYDVIRVFENEEEANKFARENSIKTAKFNK